MSGEFYVAHRHLPGGFLDPRVESFLRAIEEQGQPPLESMTAADARQAARQRLEEIDADPVPVAHVENREMALPEANIPFRIYQPEGMGPFPALVYYHGGGWVVCDLDTHDDVCRRLCNLAGCVVVSVDYRLAPEDKFPIPVEDAYDALLWVDEHAAELNADASRIAVGGDSAGGNLSAVTALLVRDRGGPELALQLLIYPVTDLSSFNTQSYREYEDGYFLTRGMMEWFRDQYLVEPDDARSPHVSPLPFADLFGLPPALVITAEYDPLRDEGEAYAKRLHDAGVDVRCSRYNGMIHAFWSLAYDIPEADAAHQEAAKALRETFSID